MKFYQTNKVNPFASCLPLLLQLPVFIALFYMLRTDLKKRICGPALTAHGITSAKAIEKTSCNQVDPHSAKFLFIPDITHQASGIVLMVRYVMYVSSQLGSTLMMTATSDAEPAPDDACPAACLRSVHLQIPGGIAGLLDHHERLDPWPAVLRAPNHEADSAEPGERRDRITGRAPDNMAPRAGPIETWSRRWPAWAPLAAWPGLLRHLPARRRSDRADDDEHQQCRRPA